MPRCRPAENALVFHWSAASPYQSGQRAAFDIQIDVVQHRRRRRPPLRKLCEHRSNGNDSLARLEGAVCNDKWRSIVRIDRVLLLCSTPILMNVDRCCVRLGQCRRAIGLSLPTQSGMDQSNNTAIPKSPACGSAGQVRAAAKTSASAWQTPQPSPNQPARLED